tara:strand:- start:235 stop:456 length:222 start_codon:yes stop_codon:yes gene_type:complete
MDNIMTTAKFSAMIEGMVKELNITYMDAIVHYCSRNDIEIETAAKLLNTIIKSKIEAEAMDLNYLPKEAKLPL